MSNVTDATTDVDIAQRAAAAGAAVVRAAYGGTHTRQAKSGLDFVTDVDIDAERAIFDVVARERPNDRRIGEETGTTGGAGTRRWLVDPLCGTLNFAARTPLFAVNVALVDDTAVLAAVSVDPLADETFWTDGHRAMVRRGPTDAPATPSGESQLVNVNCGAAPHLDAVLD